jgi:hypothetical protein
MIYFKMILGISNFTFHLFTRDKRIDPKLRDVRIIFIKERNSSL